MKLRILITAAMLAVGSAPLVVSAQETIASKLEHQGKSKYIQITDIMSRERGGLITLRIEMTNTDNEPHRAYWRVKWLDASGFQVWDDEHWKPVLVQGAAKQNIQATSPTPKATDFRIQFNATEQDAQP